MVFTHVVIVMVMNNYWNIIKGYDGNEPIRLYDICFNNHVAHISGDESLYWNIITRLMIIMVIVMLI